MNSDSSVTCGGMVTDQNIWSEQLTLLHTLKIHFTDFTA